MEIGRTGRVQVEDMVFLVRKDARKYARVKDLLTMNEELKKARKAFDEVKYAGVWLIFLCCSNSDPSIWHCKLPIKYCVNFLAINLVYFCKKNII